MEAIINFFVFLNDVNIVKIISKLATDYTIMTALAGFIIGYTVKKTKNTFDDKLWEWIKNKFNFFKKPNHNLQGKEPVEIVIFSEASEKEDWAAINDEGEQKPRKKFNTTILEEGESEGKE